MKNMMMMMGISGALRSRLAVSPDDKKDSGSLVMMVYCLRCRSMAKIGVDPAVNSSGTRTRIAPAAEKYAN